MANREEEISITSLVEKAEGIKDLIDKVAGDVISNGSQFIHNLGHAQGYPYHILIMREPRRVRLGDLHYSPRPLGMLGKRTPAPGTSLANAALVARNHLLSLSFSVDIYAKSLGERTSGGAFFVILRDLHLLINLRNFLQLSHTI